MFRLDVALIVRTQKILFPKLAVPEIQFSCRLETVIKLPFLESYDCARIIGSTYRLCSMPVLT